MNINAYWNHFLKETGKDLNTTYIEAFHFERNELLANELLALVLKGQKQATASSIHYYEMLGERLPKVHDYSIVTNWQNEPKCIIETTSVTVLPFHEITYEICAKEGEDDTLDSWRAGHRRFFMAEGKELGYTFHDDMPVVFEEFKVVYPL